MTGNVVTDNAHGYHPFRIDLHIGNLARQQRCLGLQRPAGGSHVYHRIRTDSPQMESRHINDHIFLMILYMQLVTPTTTFHVDSNLVTKTLV